MKRILTILAATLLLTAAMAGTASASSYDSVAEELSAIGVFRGTAGGFELDRAPTRSEAAIMLVRLYGAEDEAKAAYEAGEISMPFTDVSETAAPSVAWLYSQGITNGTSATTFGASSLYGDNVIEKHGINRDRTGDREKTRYLCGKQGIFTRDRALIRPGFIRQLETRASTRSASFFHALGSPGRPHNGGGAAGAYRTRNGAKPLKQGHLRAKRGPLGPSRKSQQQTKRTGFAAHGHSIAETAPEGKRASCANGALIRA